MTSIFLWLPLRECVEVAEVELEVIIEQVLCPKAVIIPWQCWKCIIQVTGPDVSWPQSAFLLGANGRDRWSSSRGCEIVHW